MSQARAPRNTLDRGKIVDAARELLDREGMDALSMRRLADALGVRPMSLYHHLATKDELIDALVDSVFGEIELPEPSAQWKAELSKRSRSMRAVLTGHPWALPLMETRANPGAKSLEHHEATLNVLRSAGFSVPAAAHGYAILDAFVYGFVLNEIMLSSVGLDTDAEELARGMDFSATPRIAEVAQMYVEAENFVLLDSFEVGLELTLEGIEKLRGKFD